MLFPISGVEVHPLLPPLVAFIVATITTPAGVSGAFLLLPFQVSVLGFASPAVSATNLIYNIVAIPGGLARYIGERRMVWPLAAVVIAGTAPGVILGGLLRVHVFAGPRRFSLFAGLVLIYLGGRLVFEVARRVVSGHGGARVTQAGGTGRSRLGRDAVVTTRSWTLTRVEYGFDGVTYTFPVVPVFLLAVIVGIAGGIYGIGGGAIIAPFVVSVFGLPVYTVAGAALAGTFATSIVGVGFFSSLAATGTPGVAPDWALGVLFGLGGLAGTYCGARLQRYLPEIVIRGVLGILVLALGARYVAKFFI